jgi:hypothetical protein
MAALKGELFPTGSLLGGTNPHVSLLEALSFQSSRDKDGGILEAGSQFWTHAADWVRQDPLLVATGSAAAVLSLFLLRRQPVVGLVGLATLLLWLFLARGGLVLPFYLVPLLPLLALNVALAIWYVSRRVAPGRLPQSIRGPGGVVLQAALMALAVGILISGHLGPALAARRDPLEMWRSDQALAQQRSLDWVRDHLPPTATVMLDDAVWTDLRDGPAGEPTFEHAHWYWKIGLDPAIRDGVFENDWRTIDYVMVSGQLRNDVVHPGMELPRAALERSTQLVTFNTGGWPIDIHRGNHVQRLPVADDTLLLRIWDGTRSQITRDGMPPGISVADRQLATGLAMLQAVYADDHATFERAFSAWQQSVNSSGHELIASQYAALSLAFAGDRWISTEYRANAAAVLAKLWDEYAIQTPSGYLLGLKGASPDGIEVPVASFLPFAYQVFERVDPAHPWSALREDGYQMLGRAAARRSVSTADVLPDTILISTKYGHVIGAASDAVSGRGATQLTWQLSLDSVWRNDGRADELLTRIDLNAETYVRDGALQTVVNLDGTPAGSSAKVADAALMTGSVLLGTEPEAAHRLLGEHVLRPLLAGHQVGFLDRSWAWLATALLDGGLADLSSGRPVVDWRGDL